MTEDERERREAIGRRLVELREPRTQQWVADHVGVTSRTVQAWEYGESRITGDNLEAVAKLFKVPEEYILYGSDRRPEPDQLNRIERLLTETAGRLERIEELLARRELEDVADQLEDEPPATAAG